jgi:hypothetical protein
LKKANIGEEYGTIYQYNMIPYSSSKWYHFLYQYGSIFSSNMDIIEIEDFSSSFSKQAFLFFEIVAFSFSG